MGTNQNVIEINGKKYNAITGKMLEPQAQNSSGNKNGGGRNVDGFTKRKQVPSQKTVSTSQKSSQHQTTRTPASHVNKSPQKSQTLMRSAVKKPAPVKTAKNNVQPTRVAGIAKPTLKTPKQRQTHAATTQKSGMVSHFGGDTARSSVVKKVQHLPVKPVKNHETRPVSLKTIAAPTIDAEPVQNQSRGASAMIEKALSNATAHENSHHSVKKHGKLSRKFGISSRAVAISSTVLAGVLLGGFFAVQNVPNLSMRVASARAGFNATLPGYNPSGFSFAGPINYNPGQVTISYRSNTDDRSYELTQRASNWNSEALLSNFVVASNEPYQTYLDRGRTLYIYDGSNATWVDNGIWYQVEGNSQMTSDQLVRIAASM